MQMAVPVITSSSAKPWVFASHVGEVERGTAICVEGADQAETRQARRDQFTLDLADLMTDDALWGYVLNRAAEWCG